jgi:long-chain acyl-CoA synthetase
LGGKVRMMLTGSAPIDKTVMETLKVCFCCPFLEGYGMTETAAGSVIMSIKEKEFGHVGGPVANVKLRLRDIPDMGYFHDDTKNPPKGEVMFQGSSIMKGYFKNPEKTAETIKDGWLYSGDVAEVRPDGSIKIVDRAKNIFKLS